MPRTFKDRNIPCAVDGCTRSFTNRGGLSNHLKLHRIPQRNPQRQTTPPEQDPYHDNDAMLDDAEPQAENVEQPSIRREKLEIHPLMNGDFEVNFYLNFNCYIFQAFHVTPTAR